MLDHFRSIGISYKEANLNDRSIISLADAEVESFISYVKDTCGITEIIAISTCNRTEIFYTNPQDLSYDLFKAVFSFRGQLVQEELFNQFIQFTGKEAVKRLFDISIGLESKVLGDLQIINQAKKAYQACADLDMAGPFLHRLMHGIFFTNKRVVQETAFRDGAASVSYATYELIDELSSSIISPKILIVGLGEMGKDIARHLQVHDVENVLLMNRTYATAESLAEELGFEARKIEDLERTIVEADIIVAATGTTEPIIKKDYLSTSEDIVFKYFIDISVPKAIESEISTVDGVELYTVDDIENKTSEALAKRQKAIPQVQNLVEEGVHEFSKWSTELEVSPTIQKLKTALEQIRKEEIAKYLNKMDEGQSEMVDMVTKSMMQKIIKLPVLELKAACKRGEAETLIDVLSGIFNLEEENVKS